jgi:transmembrane sensor
MRVSNYSVEDFVLDPEFKKWVLDGDPDAKRFWESFIALHPHKAEEMDQARTILVSMTRPKINWSQSEQDTFWKEIDQKIDKIKGVEERKKVISIDSWSSIQHFKQHQIQKRQKANFRKIIFFLTIFIGIGGVYFFQLENKVTKIANTPIEYVIRESPSGVKSTMSLPDGSKVMLNSGSSIRYEKFFSGDLRSVFLQGEAYFEVKKDPMRAFIVVANGVKTYAIGTSFNIRAYDYEPIFVSLLSGIVEVNSESDATLNERLAPGEGIIAEPSTQNWRKEKFDVDQVMAWTNKTIFFEEIPFLESIEILEKWFGVKILIIGSVPKGLVVSGKFRDETLQNILEGLSYSSRFEYQISDKEVQINFKPKNN